jgi:hypothetical protein
MEDNQSRNSSANPTFSDNEHWIGNPIMLSTPALQAACAPIATARVEEHHDARDETRPAETGGA